MLKESKTFQTTLFSLQPDFQRALQFIAVEGEREHFPRRMWDEGKLCMRYQNINHFHTAAMGTGITASMPAGFGNQLPHFTAGKQCGMYSCAIVERNNENNNHLPRQTANITLVWLSSG